MALSIITDKFRIENAKKFVQAMKNRPYPGTFSTSQSDYERVKTSKLEGELDNMYMFIGKITPWFADGTETPVPDVNGNFRQDTEIWSNALAAKKVEITDIAHVTFRENWTDNETYPFYSSDQTNTSTFNDPSSPNFFVLDEQEFRVYKCLFNNYESPSTERPSDVGGVGGDPIRVQREPFYTPDGYLWKYMYTIDPSLAVSFLTDEYMPVRKDIINDILTDDNSSVDGAIYRIWFPQKSNDANAAVASPAGIPFARIRVEGIDSSTDIGTDTLTIDLTNTDNSDRIAATVANNDDMVGYQVEHIIDDGTTKEIEIAEITASTVEETGGSRTVLTLTVKSLSPLKDPGQTTQFSIPSSAAETWFISPLIDIRGEGENASAMMMLVGENGFDSTTRVFAPVDAVSREDALDIIMNTNGNGYYNIYERNEFDGTPESLVVIRQGLAEIGETAGGNALTPGDQTIEQDREILNVAEIVSVTPYGGHSYDNVSELYAYTIMINQTFDGGEAGSATVQNDFRQIALIQNPIEQDGSLANAAIYRQTIRLEFNGDITTSIDYDDEISDQSDTDAERNLFGRVVKLEYLSVENKTQVYLSSSFGMLSRTAQEVYDINAGHNLYVSYDASSGLSPFTLLTMSDRMIVPGSDGQYQKGLASNADQGLQFLTGDLFYVENRKPIIRASDQSENVKLVVEY